MSTPTDSATVHPCARFGGQLEVPGDKSISHRVALLASLAQGTSTVDGFLFSGDCLSSLKAMEALGAVWTRSVSGSLSIRGTGGRLVQPDRALDAGNSGTTIRLLAGLLAGFPITVEITGDDSLRKRPMGRIREPLEKMGARVELLGPGGCAPIRITGGGLRGIDYTLPVASAQVKSCVLLAGLSAQGRTRVQEPRPTRDHTERLLTQWGVRVQIQGLRIELEGFGPAGFSLPARSWTVPGDFSSAAFSILGAAHGKNKSLTVRNVGLNPRRTAFLNVLKRMGAGLEIRIGREAGLAEEMGEVTIRSGSLKATEVGGDEIPNLIDELPLVAAAGALAEGQTVIRDAGELRVKESDRIATMAANLAVLGVRVKEKPDGLVVEGGARLNPRGPVDSYGDHRVAMAMGVLALYAEKPVCIQHVACVETSYPEFWNDLRSLGAHVEK